MLQIQRDYKTVQVKQRSVKLSRKVWNAYESILRRLALIDVRHKQHYITTAFVNQ